MFSRREKYLYAKEYATMELVAICEAVLENGVDEILLNTVHVVEYHRFPRQVRMPPVSGIGGRGPGVGISAPGPRALPPEAAEGALRALKKSGEIKPLKIEDPVTLKVRYQFAERATDAVSAVKGAVRIDERTVSVTHPNLAALRDNFGAIRAPEHELYARDLDMDQTTGLFTRYGPEPYESAPTSPEPKR